MLYAKILLLTLLVSVNFSSARAEEAVVDASLEPLTNAPAGNAERCHLEIDPGYLFADFKVYADGALAGSYMRCNDGLEALAQFEKVGCQVDWAEVKAEVRRHVVSYVDPIDIHQYACLAYLSGVLHK